MAYDNTLPTHWGKIQAWVIIIIMIIILIIFPRGLSVLTVPVMKGKR